MLFNRKVCTNATVLSKEENPSVAMLTHAGGGGLPGNRFRWKASFQTDERVENFIIEADEAAGLSVGSSGTLKYRGTHFISFTVEDSIAKL